MNQGRGAGKEGRGRRWWCVVVVCVVVVVVCVGARKGKWCGGGVCRGKDRQGSGGTFVILKKEDL